MKHTLESLLELSKTPEGIQQIRIMVAELDGWTECILEKDGYAWGVNPNLIDNECGGWMSIPKYPEDLNAVHEVEEKIPSSQVGFYAMYLVRVVGPKVIPAGEDFKMSEMCWHATALQRCIALILTLQKP
jgi:hypothetical protein